MNNSLKGKMQKPEDSYRRETGHSFPSKLSVRKDFFFFFFELEMFNWELCQNWDWNPGPWQKCGCGIQEEHCAPVLGGQSQAGLCRSWTDIRMARWTLTWFMGLDRALHAWDLSHLNQVSLYPPVWEQTAPLSTTIWRKVASTTPLAMTGWHVCH